MGWQFFRSIASRNWIGSLNSGGIRARLVCVPFGACKNGRRCAKVTTVPTSDTKVPSDAESGRQWFATTHWSVVLTAKQGDASEAAGALEKLCRAYWPPLYAYIRRDGCDATEAQDLTQEFFVRLLAKDYLQYLHHQQGKFRSFLLAYSRTSCPNNAARLARKSAEADVCSFR